MKLWRDPRVLHDDWTPPRLLGRDGDLERIRGVLPFPLHEHPSATVVVSGPRGSGTSALARWTAHTLLRAWSAVAPRREPFLLRVDVTHSRTPSRSVAELFRGIDPELSARGISSEELTLLLLRRLRTLQRPAVLWFDQVRASTSELPRVLGPLSDPASLMPEGSERLPPYALLVSGEVDPLEARRGSRAGAPPLLHLPIGPLPPDVLLEAIEVRSRLAFSQPPEESGVRAVREVLLSRGGGLSLAGAVLEESGRRALARGSDRLEARDVQAPLPTGAGQREARAFDECLLSTLYDTAHETGQESLALAEVRPLLRERCRERGIGDVTPARLWRHLVALEREGALRRDVRLGGTGGTLTRLRLPGVEGMRYPVATSGLAASAWTTGGEPWLSVTPGAPSATPPLTGTPNVPSPPPHLPRPPGPRGSVGGARAPSARRP